MSVEHQGIHQRSPWHDWVLCWPPVPVDSVQVAVAHACVGDLDEHVLGPQRTTSELVGRQHMTRVACSPAQRVGICCAIDTIKLYQQHKSNSMVFDVSDSVSVATACRRDRVGTGYSAQQSSAGGVS